jgi:hypothetical protein
VGRVEGQCPSQEYFALLGALGEQGELKESLDAAGIGVHRCLQQAAGFGQVSALGRDQAGFQPGLCLAGRIVCVSELL